MNSTERPELVSEVQEGGAKIALFRSQGTPLETVQFSQWRNGEMARGPFEISEMNFLILFSKALTEGVFSDAFKDGLRAKLTSEA